MSDVTVSFGAFDEGVARAARRMASELATTERAQSRLNGTTRVAAKGFEKLAESAAGPLGKFAKYGAAGVAIAGVAAAWRAAANASEAYAKVDKATQLALDVTAAKAEDFWAKVGKQLGTGVSQPWTTIKAGLSDAMGTDPELQSKHSDLMMKDARLRQDMALARTADEAAFILQLHEEETAYLKIRTALEAARRAGVISLPQFQNQAKVELESHSIRTDKLMQAQSAREAAAMREQKALQDAANDAGNAQMQRAYEMQKTDREALANATAEAHIDELRARGMDKQAAKEQIALTASRQRLAIAERLLATEEERQRAVDAVNASEAAQIRALGMPEDAPAHSPASRSLAPGLYSSTLNRQVFGGGGGQGESTPKKLDKQTKVLEDIKKGLDILVRENRGFALA